MNPEFWFGQGILGAIFFLMILVARWAAPRVEKLVERLTTFIDKIDNRLEYESHRNDQQLELCKLHGGRLSDVNLQMDAQNRAIIEMLRSAKILVAESYAGRPDLVNTIQTRLDDAEKIIQQAS